jgi:hypothetical protein
MILLFLNGLIIMKKQQAFWQAEGVIINAVFVLSLLFTTTGPYGEAERLKIFCLN